MRTFVVCVMVCYLAIGISAIDEHRPKKKAEDRGKRNLEYQISHHYSNIPSYRLERRIAAGLQYQNPSQYYSPPYRKGRPQSYPIPPYAVQMEPLVHYSQRDPLYDTNILPVDPHNEDLLTENNHIQENVDRYGGYHKPHIIERPVYIKEPEPIIEIIIKESNVSLPAPPPPPPPPKKKKEQVQVFYVKYKKNPDGYGKDSIIYDKPVPAIAPPIPEEEEPEQEPAPYSYSEEATLPPPPSTTLRTIIKPDSEFYHSPSGVKVTFGKEGFDYDKRSSKPEDYIPPQTSGLLPQGRQLTSFSNAYFKRPTSGNFQSIPPGFRSDVRPEFRPDNRPAQPYRTINLPQNNYKPFGRQTFSQQSPNFSFQPQQLGPTFTSFAQQPPPPSAPQFAHSVSHPPPPRFQSKPNLPQIRQPVPYKPFDNLRPQQQFSQPTPIQHQPIQFRPETHFPMQQQLPLQENTRFNPPRFNQQFNSGEVLPQSPQPIIQQQQQQQQQQQSPQNLQQLPNARPLQSFRFPQTITQNFQQQSLNQQQQQSLSQQHQQSLPQQQKSLPQQHQQSLPQPHQNQQHQQSLSQQHQHSLPQPHQNQQQQQKTLAQQHLQQPNFQQPLLPQLPQQPIFQHQPQQQQQQQQPIRTQFQQQQPTLLQQQQQNIKQQQNIPQYQQFSSNQNSPFVPSQNQNHQPQQNTYRNPEKQQNFQNQQSTNLLQNEHLSNLQSAQNILPPGGQLIQSVSKYEQHISSVETSPTQNLSPQQYQQKIIQQFNQNSLSQEQNSQELLTRQQSSSHQKRILEEAQKQNNLENYIPNYSQKSNSAEERQPSQKAIDQRNQLLEEIERQRQQQEQLRQFYQQNPDIKQDVVTNLVSTPQPNYAISRKNVEVSSTPKYQFQSTTKSSTAVPPPSSTKNTKELEAQLPDEVPDELRQQLLSSGILDHAQISVLDYDKVGDIPLDALPPDQLANFYGAGGAAQLAAAAGSDPVPAVVRKDGTRVENHVELEDQDPESAASEQQLIVASPLVSAPAPSSVEMKVVRYNPETDKGQQVQEKYVEEESHQVDPVVLNDNAYNRIRREVDISATREEALQLREEGLQSRETLLETRDADLEAREDALEEREYALESREKALETREKGLEMREKGIETRETVLQMKEKALQTKEMALQMKEITLQAKDMVLRTNKTALEKKEIVLQSKEKALKTKEIGLQTKEILLKANKNDNYKIRYLPLKINGTQFPIPDVPELKGRKISSIVVLAPISYDFSSKRRRTRETTREISKKSNDIELIEGTVLKDLLTDPSSDNFKKFLENENRTSSDKQAVILLVADSPRNKVKEIFMYDVATQSVSKLNGELSSAFVEAAEANSSDKEEAASNRVERIAALSEDGEEQIPYKADLEEAPSELFESKVPIIDPLQEEDMETQASEHLESFVDISGHPVDDLMALSSKPYSNYVRTRNS